MKVKWTALVDSAHGGVDKKHYARAIPGNNEYAAVCNKPELSKKTKKKKAAHPTCKSFADNIALCKGILNNPERRAAWQARYDKAVREARRHNKPIQGRLYDYIKHELSEARKKGLGKDWVMETLGEAPNEHPISIQSASDEHPMQP